MTVILVTIQAPTVYNEGRREQLGVQKKETARISHSGSKAQKSRYTRNAVL